MIASAALVLTALSVTGVLVRNNLRQEEENNIIDFSALENGGDKNGDANMSEEETGTLSEVGTDDLDYDPYFQEANSAQVTNTASDSGNQDTDDQNIENNNVSKANKNENNEEQP